MVMELKQPTPFDLLMAEYAPEADVAAVEAQVQQIQEAPVVVPLGALQTPVYGNDPNELLKHRFLYRGAVCLLCGPTGVGKSALIMQMAIYWSVGKAVFGIEPGETFQRKGMRIVLVQAENDEGDLAEMRNGVLGGCDDLTDEEKELALGRIMVRTITDKNGNAFAAELEAMLAAANPPYDLVMVDPAFAFLGGDSNSQRDVSYFMRGLLNPLLQKYRIGMVLAHHTNKPLRGKEKEGWAAGDFAYLGAGSAEWINPARAALAIRSIGSDSVFELRAAKRGRRLGWVDAGGLPTNVQCIVHDGRPGVICWHTATPEQVASTTVVSKLGRPRKCEMVEVIHLVALNPSKNQGFYKAALSRGLGCSESAVQCAIIEGTCKGLIEARIQGREKVYICTPEGIKLATEKTAAVDWTHQIPTSAESE